MGAALSEQAIELIYVKPEVRFWIYADGFSINNEPIAIESFVEC